MEQKQTTAEDFIRMLKNNLALAVIYGIALFALPIFSILDSR